MQRYGPKGRLAAAAATVVLVAGCEERSRPIDAPQPAPLAELAAAELAYAEPAQVQYYQPEQGYRWAERAYGLQRTFYDAPPDYGFYYDEVEPYVWETADDWALYAEPWDGDYRYYYYEPGAEFPYFVRDREYGYAYGAAGVLIAVFDTGGRYLPIDVVRQAAPAAGRYYARGHDLRRASREARRISIDDRAWLVEGPRVSRSAGPWLRAARDEPAWRKWRERDGDRELARFRVETRKRQEAAEAWREKAARPQTAQIRGEDRRLEAEALRSPRVQVRDDRRDIQAMPRQAKADGQHAGKAQQQARAEARWSRDAERRQQVQQAERRQALRQQAQVQQRAERQARAQQEQRQRGQAERQQAQREQRARAPSAGDRGQPAAARERPAKTGAGKDNGRLDRGDRGKGKKD